MGIFDRIALDPANVPDRFKGSYRGRKFSVEVTESVSIHGGAGTWSGGSRDLYHALNLATGESRSVTDTMTPPWEIERRPDRTIALRDGFAIVRHSMFQGKDMGLTFYVHPSNAGAFLPTPADALDTDSAMVLNIISQYKSAYRGQYYNALNGLTSAKAEAIKATLASLGYLDSRGAITPKGRNAVNANRVRPRLYSWEKA